MTRLVRVHQLRLDDYSPCESGFVLDPRLVRIGRVLDAGPDPELLADIRKHGIRSPLLVDSESGVLVDGYHRLSVARFLGVDPPVLRLPGGSPEFAREMQRRDPARRGRP